MKALKLFAVKAAIVGAVSAPVLALAQTAAPDFSGMTNQIDWSSVIAAVLLIAGGLAGVYVIMKGADLILARIRK